MRGTGEEAGEARRQQRDVRLAAGPNVCVAAEGPLFHCERGPQTARAAAVASPLTYSQANFSLLFVGRCAEDSLGGYIQSLSAFLCVKDQLIFFFLSFNERTMTRRSDMFFTLCFNGCAFKGLSATSLSENLVL